MFASQNIFKWSNYRHCLSPMLCIIVGLRRSHWKAAIPHRSCRNIRIINGVLQSEVHLWFAHLKFVCHSMDFIASVYILLLYSINLFRKRKQQGPTWEQSVKLVRCTNIHIHLDWGSRKGPGIKVLILGLCPANESRCYFVMRSLIG